MRLPRSNRCAEMLFDVRGVNGIYDPLMLFVVKAPEVLRDIRNNLNLVKLGWQMTIDG